MSEKDKKPVEAATDEKPERPRRAVKVVPSWIWPVGLAAAGLGAAATFLLRGCWHNNMGWPMRYGEHSYQTCNDCGIMRLFDEKRFRPFGPYGYDLDKLIEGHKERRRARMSRAGKSESAEDEDFSI